MREMDDRPHAAARGGQAPRAREPGGRPAAPRHVRDRRGGRRHREHHRGARRAGGLRRRARRAAHRRRPPRRRRGAAARGRGAQPARRPRLADALRRAHPPLHLGGRRQPLPEPRRSSATSPTRCASGTSCSTACRASATRCTTRPTCSRRCWPATATAPARSCASTCSTSSASSSRPSAGPDRRVPEAVGAHAPRRALVSARTVAAAVRLEVRRQREEHLRGRERVAGGHVRPVRRAGSSAAATAASAHQPGSPVAALRSHSARQSTAVSTIRRGMPEAQRRAAAGAGSRAPSRRRAPPGCAPRSAATSGAKASRRGAERRRGRRRAGRGSRPTPASGAAAGLTRPVTLAPAPDAATVDRHGREREHLVAAPVEPRRLDVDGDEAGARARSVTAAAEAELQPDPALDARDPPERLLQRRPRQRSRGSCGSIRSSGASPARSCSTWCSMRSSQNELEGVAQDRGVLGARASRPPRTPPGERASTPRSRRLPGRPSAPAPRPAAGRPS